MAKKKAVTVPEERLVLKREIDRLVEELMKQYGYQTKKEIASAIELTSPDLSKLKSATDSSNSEEALKDGIASLNDLIGRRQEEIINKFFQYFDQFKIKNPDFTFLDQYGLNSTILDSLKDAENLDGLSPEVYRNLLDATEWMMTGLEAQGQEGDTSEEKSLPIGILYDESQESQVAVEAIKKNFKSQGIWKVTPISLKHDTFKTESLEDIGGLIIIYTSSIHRNQGVKEGITSWAEQNEDTPACVVNYSKAPVDIGISMNVPQESVGWAPYFLLEQATRRTEMFRKKAKIWTHIGISFIVLCCCLLTVQVWLILHPERINKMNLEQIQELRESWEKSELDKAALLSYLLENEKLKFDWLSYEEFHLNLWASRGRDLILQIGRTDFFGENPLDGYMGTSIAYCAAKREGDIVIVDLKSQKAGPVVSNRFGKIIDCQFSPEASKSNAERDRWLGFFCIPNKTGFVLCLDYYGNDSTFLYNPLAHRTCEGILEKITMQIHKPGRPINFEPSVNMR